MDNLPQRKSIRLKDWDYSTAGMYFITICTKDRKNLFWKNADKNKTEYRKISRIRVGAVHEPPENRLSSCGRIVDEIICELPEKFNIEINEYVIMPNHIHLLFTIKEERAIRESPLRGKRSVVSKAVGYLKMNSSKKIHYLMPEIDVWQRSYYDHIIRNEADYMEKAEYIANNPANWSTDIYYI
ncbi:MAG: transposase [Oscillospiraceae bacterium]|nr:transposase [Oscillospiraceae bacterium]